MGERHYTDDEVAAIFKQAAELDHAQPPGTAEHRGLTLGALQDIGAQVGLSPASIAQAAAGLDRAGRVATRRFLGMPIGVGRSVELERAVSEPEWEALVAELRNTFAAAGTVRQDGSFRQWSNGNLRALLEPTAHGGHRLRLQTVKGDSLALMTSGGVMLGAAAVTLGAFAIAGGLDNSGVVAGLGVLGLSGGAMVAAGALSVAKWARGRRVQFEELISRFGRS
jgi:hypothetical protein